MGRTTYKTACLIFERIKKIAEGDKLSRSTLQQLIEIFAGSEERTIRKYTEALVRFGFLEREGPASFKINRMAKELS